jgi:hypothetical protein
MTVPQSRLDRTRPERKGEEDGQTGKKEGEVREKRRGDKTRGDKRRGKDKRRHCVRCGGTAQGSREDRVRVVCTCEDQRPVFRMGLRRPIGPHAYPLEAETFVEVVVAPRSSNPFCHISSFPSI